MNLQHSHESTPFSEKKHNLVLMCDGVSGPANLGGLFRLCDAFGVQEMVCYNSEVDLSSSRLKKTARNTESRVPCHKTVAPANIIEDYRNNGYLVIGLEITLESIPIQQLQLPGEAKIILVVGSEQYGISKTILDLLDHTVHIEMYGLNSSMNVTQAAAIALFELTKS